MIIKDHIGDWALCVANWAGMHKGVKIGRHYISGNPGQFVASISYLREPHKNQNVVNMRPGHLANIKPAFSVDKMNFTMGDALISIDLSEEPLHQVALAFTLSTLYLLVQPRPETITSFPRNANGRRVSVL